MKSYVTLTCMCVTHLPSSLLVSLWKFNIFLWKFLTNQLLHSHGSKGVQFCPLQHSQKNSKSKNFGEQNLAELKSGEKRQKKNATSKRIKHWKSFPKLTVALNQDWKIFCKAHCIHKKNTSRNPMCHSRNQSKLLHWLPLFMICHFRKYINDFAIKELHRW